MVSKKKTLGIGSTDLNDIKPITENQKEVFSSYSKGQNLFLYGVAGTGKTFVALYNALKDVLDPKSPRERVYIVRSLLPTRDIGFLPGDEEDKSYLYQVPYQNMVRFMFKQPDERSFDQLYNNLRNQGTIDFLSTSFLRGVTIDNGVMHMMGLANIPMIVLFGPTNSEKFAPKNNYTKILDSKKLNGTKDIDSISVDDVYNLI